MGLSVSLLIKQYHSGSHIPPEEIIFVSGIFVAFALLTVRYEEIGGNQIPVVIFKNHPTLFHGFLLAFNLGFTAAVMTMSLRSRNRPSAWICRNLAVVCCVFAAGVVSCATLASYFPTDFPSVYAW